MANDRDKAFEVEEGVLLSEDGVHITDGVSIPTFTGKAGDRYYRTNGEEYYLEVDGNSWILVSAGGDNNIDGGFANSNYLPDQCFDGGNA